MKDDANEKQRLLITGSEMKWKRGFQRMPRMQHEKRKRRRGRPESVATVKDKRNFYHCEAQVMRRRERRMRCASLDAAVSSATVLVSPPPPLSLSLSCIIIIHRLTCSLSRALSPSLRRFSCCAIISPSLFIFILVAGKGERAGKPFTLFLTHC